MANGCDLDSIYDRYCDAADVKLCTTAKRRGGGQPNRGGGRGNRGGGRGRGRGGSGSSSSQGRGRGSSSASSSGRTGGSRKPDRGTTGPHARSRDRNAAQFQINSLADVDIITSDPSQQRRSSTHNRSKVALQHLHMSAENQALVRETLHHLQAAQGSEGLALEEDDESEYPDDFEEELDFRLEDQYWTETSQLVVEDTARFAETDEDPINNQALELQQSYKRAVERVQRYGFDRGRCEQALDMVEGDIGRALELLLCMCCDITQDLSDTEGALDPDVLEQRQDEMFALTAIYEDAFVERIPNCVWVVQLELPFLNEHFKKLISSNSRRTLAYDDDDSVEICPWYLKGNCKFGRRCRLRHINPRLAEQERKNDPSQLKYMYELEIRFPAGHTYPLKPPLVAFSSLNPLASSHVCLNVTVYLLRAAVEMSSQGCGEGQPLVFQLVSLLEDEDKLQELCDLRAHEFSNPQPVIYRTPRSTVQRKIEPPVTDSSIKEPSISNNGPGDPVEPKTYQDYKPIKKRNDGSPKKVNLSQMRRLNSQLKEKFRKVQDQGSYKSMQSSRQQLPAWARQEAILESLEQSQILVISGATGCGKTTQVPQFILDDWLRQPGQDYCNILCTQPRRLSATAVAQRVANERTEKLGNSVGYQIRLESVMSASTRLLFCTTGILLRRLVGDALLDGVSHVILDEVHERSRESDFLLMVLRDLLKKRSDLKVILMSATLNADLFADYFGTCPVIEIPGRTFPVEQLFLEDALEFTGYTIEERSPYANSKKNNKVQAWSVEELEQGLAELSYGLNEEPPKHNVMDHRLSLKQLFLRYQDYSKSTIKTLAMLDMEKINYDLIECVLTFIVEGEHEYPEEGAILVFLPGMQEITTMYEQLLGSRTFGGRNKQRYWLIPLHSTLSSEDQQRVFKRPSKGVTKIVLATNIAETSITIDDVVFVVDCGHMKEKRYDASKGMESLETVWVSRANALQRKGRAGRVAAGVCFHLFTSQRYENHLQEQPIPEIQRVPLEQLVLWIKTLPLFSDITLEAVFLSLVEPPAEESINASVRRLEQLGALDSAQYLTPLGYHLAQLPVDVRIGKLMIFGAVFRCLDSTLTIAACLSFKSPFVSPFDKRDEADKKKQEFAIGNSDHLTMLKAYKGWQEAQGRGTHAGYCYCQENYLSINTLKMLCSMKQQFAVLLSDIGFIMEGLTTRAMERRGRHGTDGVSAVTGPEANSNNLNSKLVAALLVAALYPNVVQVRTPETKFQLTGAGAVPKAPTAQELRFSTKKDGFVHIHPSSVNFQVRKYESPYLVYHEMVKTSKVYIRDCTMVSVYPLLLFCGGAITIDLHSGQYLLSVDDGWIRFVVQSHEVATLVRELRLELDRLLQDKIESPSMDLATCPRGSKIIQTIVQLITTQ